MKIPTQLILIRVGKEDWIVAEPIVETHYEEPTSLMQFITPDTLQSIINRRDPIEDIVDSIKGIRRNREGTVINKSKSPLMNDKGVESMVRKLKALLSQNTILTKLSENEIKLLVRNLGKTVIFDLRLHYKEYGLKDTAQMSDVFWIVISCIYCALKSSVEGFTFGNIAPMYRKTETIKPEAPRLNIPGFGGR